LGGGKERVSAFIFFFFAISKEGGKKIGDEAFSLPTQMGKRGGRTPGGRTRAEVRRQIGRIKGERGSHLCIYLHPA